MNYPQILHHGAIAGVTGLCHQLQMNVRHVLLVDCGLFQGAEVSPYGGARASGLAIDSLLAGISALVAHSCACRSRWVYSLAAGFKGAILCGELAAKLLPVVLEDAFQLVFSRDRQQVERYLELLESRIIALAYGSWFTLVGIAQLKVAIRLQRAGHILGSICVDIGLLYKQSGTSKRIVCSGELGALHSSLLPAPKASERADILVIESTFGDLLEDRRSRRQRLERIIERALAGNGTVLIPVFSIGGARELLCELEDIIHNHPALAGRCAGAQEASAPLSTNIPIVDYLKAMLRDPRHDVLYVGYKAQGAPGRAIQAYGPKGGHVELDDGRYKIGARICMIGGYSVHADQQGRVNFFTQTCEWLSEIRIVHGEGVAKNTLAAQYRQANRDVDVKILSGVGNPSLQEAGR